MTQTRTPIGTVTAAHTPRIWPREYCGISARSVGFIRTSVQVGFGVVFVMACAPFESRRAVGVVQLCGGAGSERRVDASVDQ